MSTQAISPFAAFAASTQQKDSTSATTDNSTTGASEQMFLQLLVAQLKNQDPMQPSDGTQFVAQLAQFSELEQVMAIRQDADTVVKAQSSTTTTTGSTGQTGN